MTIADGSGASKRSGRRSSGSGRRASRRETDRLHRRTARLEDVLSVLLAVLIAAGVCTALLAAGSVHGEMAERAAGEALDRVPVQAVIIEDGPLTVGTAGSGAVSSATVRWTGVDGVERTGHAQVTGERRSGATVQVWTGPQGQLVAAPMTTAGARMFAVWTGSVVAGAWGAVCVGLGRAGFAWTGRRFGRAWEREWEQIEPQWSGRCRRRTDPGEES